MSDADFEHPTLEGENRFRVFQKVSSSGFKFQEGAESYDHQGSGWKPAL